MKNNRGGDHGNQYVAKDQIDTLPTADRLAAEYDVSPDSFVDHTLRCMAPMVSVPPLPVRDYPGARVKLASQGVKARMPRFVGLAVLLRGVREYALVRVLRLAGPGWQGVDNQNLLTARPRDRRAMRVFRLMGCSPFGSPVR